MVSTITATSLKWVTRGIEKWCWTRSYSWSAVRETKPEWIYRSSKCRSYAGKWSVPLLRQTNCLCLYPSIVWNCILNESARRDAQKCLLVFICWILKQDWSLNPHCEDSRDCTLNMFPVNWASQWIQGRTSWACFKNKTLRCLCY